VTNFGKLFHFPAEQEKNIVYLNGKIGQAIYPEEVDDLALQLGVVMFVLTCYKSSTNLETSRKSIANIGSNINRYLIQ
jgi:hypothetical protein